MLRTISPRVVKSMLADCAELALIDVREELIFSKIICCGLEMSRSVASSYDLLASCPA